MNLADRVMQNSMVRLAMNMRLLALDSNSYVATNIRGTESGFAITLGYIPIASKQFDNVLYILSIDPSTSICELGSFSSPGTGYSPVTEPLSLWPVSTPGTIHMVGGVITMTGTGPITSDLYNTPMVMPANTTMALRYKFHISNVSGSTITGSAVYKFYNGATLLYTKTIALTGSADIDIDTSETFLFTANITNVTFQLTKATGTAILILNDSQVLYATESGGSEEFYRPLCNLDGGPFRTLVFGYSPLDFVKMELQAEYDGSVNIILFEKDVPPRIINTKFLRADSGILQYAPDRPGTASSNAYTSASVDEQTKLILSSSTILKVAFNGITTGGKLKYGTYRYYFAYETEDFNSTDIVGQSGLCAVFTGLDAGHIKGGTSGQETDKQITLTLTNVDINYRYVKVYCLYSSGQEGLEQQLLEFTVPTEIDGTTLVFTHSGFEEVASISQDVVNTNFEQIDAARTGTQINSYLMVGGIKESSVDLSQFKAASLLVRVTEATPLNLAYSGALSAKQGYNDPGNIYSSVGYFRGEAYAARMVWVLPGGRLSPPYPVTGIDYCTSGNPTNSNGIIRFHAQTRPGGTGTSPVYDGSNLIVTGVKFDISSIPAPAIAASLGFFFVRAERNPNLLSQGYLIPTMRVPGTQFYDSTSSFFNRFQAGTESDYKLVPSLDNMLDAYSKDTASGGGDLFVIDVNNSNKLNAYLPMVVNHFGAGSADGQPSGDNLSGYIDNFPQQYYAFISADAIANEPAMISKIAQRQGMYIAQLGKVTTHVAGEITPLSAVDGGGPTVHIGSVYESTGITLYPPTGGTPTVNKAVNDCEFVPNESFATGSKFASMLGTGFHISNASSGIEYRVFLGFNSYFGIEVPTLNDAACGALNPRGGNSRIPTGTFNAGFETSAMQYHNYDTDVNAAFLVNLYPSSGLLALNSLYPDTDSLSYKQIGQRFMWGDFSGSVTIYDGDCYIVKVYRKIHQSTYRNALSPNDGRNIPAGFTISMYQESSYNTNLRNPVRYDASEPEDRSFFPFQPKGDYVAWRDYRYPETLNCSPGYSPGLGSKVFIPSDSLAPAIVTDFFSRISHSARHIPNAFRNGYRSFTGDNFRDYDSSLGRIVEMQNHRNQLLTVFEHGVGIMPVEERVLVGQDSSGPVSAEPDGVLPPNMGYPSRQIGSQHPKSIIQSPSAVYGIDVDKKKIWQMRDTLISISDDQVSSFLENNPIVNPRSGYDFKYNEVLFTTDNWTLCFREGMEKFTSFYSFLPTHYASRGSQMYGFHTAGFEKHNSPSTHRIYGSIVESYIEFVIPVMLSEGGDSFTNIYDVFEIVSNDVIPEKIEFFTYAFDSVRVFTLDKTACAQYCKVVAATDFFTQKPTINYTDKKFIVDIPMTEVANGAVDGWEVGGRMRNTYLIVRVTYATEQNLQLMSCLTTFRQSFA